MTTALNNNTVATKASFSIPSILAIICAIWGWFAGGAGLALILSIAAGVLGLIGVVFALMPGVRGGIISVISIVMGLIGILFAIVRVIA